jgi:hypothetical protein
MAKGKKRGVRKGNGKRKGRKKKKKGGKKVETPALDWKKLGVAELNKTFEASSFWHEFRYSHHPDDLQDSELCRTNAKFDALVNDLQTATAAGYISNSADAREIRFYRNLMVHLEQCRRWERNIAGDARDIQLARGPKKDVLKNRLKTQQAQLAKRIEAVHTWHTTMKAKLAASEQNAGEKPAESHNILCLGQCAVRPFWVDPDAKVNEMLIAPHAHERSDPWEISRVKDMITEIFAEKLKRDVVMRSINSPLEHLITVMRRVLQRKFVHDSPAGVVFHEQGFVAGVLKCVQLCTNGAGVGETPNFAFEMETSVPGLHRAYLFATLIGIAGEGAADVREGHSDETEGGKHPLGLHPTTAELFFDRLLRPCILAGTLGWPASNGKATTALPEDGSTVLDWLQGGDDGITTVPTRAVLKAVENSNRDLSHSWKEGVEMAKKAKTGVGPGTSRKVWTNSATGQKQYTMPEEMKLAMTFTGGFNKFSRWLLPPELQRLKKLAFKYAKEVKVAQQQPHAQPQVQIQQEAQQEARQGVDPPAVAPPPSTVEGNQSNMDWLLLEVMQVWLEKTGRHSFKLRTASTSSQSGSCMSHTSTHFRDRYRSQVAAAWRVQLMQGGAEGGRQSVD